VFRHLLVDGSRHEIRGLDFCLRLRATAEGTVTNLVSLCTGHCQVAR